MQSQDNHNQPPSHQKVTTFLALSSSTWYGEVVIEIEVKPRNIR